MRKNNKNITAGTDATNKDPSHYISPQINEPQGSKTQPNILRRLNGARFFWSVLKKKNPLPPKLKIIAEYPK